MCARLPIFSVTCDLYSRPADTAVGEVNLMKKIKNLMFEEWSFILVKLNYWEWWNGRKVDW